MKIFLRKKINIKQFLKIRFISLVSLFICLIFFIFFGDTFFNKSIALNNDKTIHSDTNSTLSNLVKSTKDLPVRLKIKAIGVDAKIEYVELNSMGEMDVPKILEEVAWYSLGTIPGQEGSAVVAGHLDGNNGETGVFKFLNKLKINDEVLVENTDGKSNTFIVTKIEYYSYEADATKIFFSSNGIHLNLITCAGKWDSSNNSYAERLIVFTDIKKNN